MPPNKRLQRTALSRRHWTERRADLTESSARLGGLAGHAGEPDGLVVGQPRQRDATVGTVLSTAGVPGLAPLPWTQTLVVFGYAMVCCLVVNDVLKIAMMKSVGLLTERRDALAFGSQARLHP